MKKFFRVMALMVTMVFMFAFAACSNQNNDNGTDGPDSTPTTAPTSAPTSAPTDVPSQGTEGSDESNSPLAGKVIEYFSASMGDYMGNNKMLMAYPNEDGTIHVEYRGEERKVTDLSASAFEAVIEALGKSGLVELNGKEEYGDGNDNASLYISFADGDYISANYGGSIAQEFTKGYEAMDACFKEILKDTPVYVPVPQVMGEVDEDLLNASLEVMNKTGISTLDEFGITEYEKNEYFAASVGLSSADGIDKAVSTAAMMMTTAYAMTIVELEDGKSIDDVRADFEKSLAWRRWVCVAPSNAMIAQKDNMVMCLMGSADLFTKTVDAAKAAGWTNMKQLENPDMN